MISDWILVACSWFREDRDALEQRQVWWKFKLPVAGMKSSLSNPLSKTI